MAFGDLVSDVVGAFDNVSALLGRDSGLPYPEDFNYVTNIIKENDKSWRKSVGYSFRVVRANDITKDADGYKEFTLQINPQQLTQDEIFAIQVTPTFSGVLVEHQGVTLKDISMSGTTGLSPKRVGPSGAFSQSGRPAFGDGVAGYTEFHNLRNYIRAYVEHKRNDKDAENGELRLIFNNKRDHEFLFVEPQKFQMKRQASRPHLYDYSIQLKGIGIADEGPKSGNFGDLLDTFIEDTIGLLDAANKIILGSADFISRVEQEFISTTLRFGNVILDSLRAGGNLKRNFNALFNGETSINKLSVENWRERVKATRDNAYDFTGGDLYGEYNVVKGRVPTLQQPNQFNENLESTYKAIKALTKLKIAGDKLLATPIDETFETEANEAKNRRNVAYKEAKKNQAKSANLARRSALEKELSRAANPARQKEIRDELAEIQADIDSAFRGEAGTNVIDTSTTSTREVTIDGSQTIQNFASRYFNDPLRFKELVVINNLKPPYIATQAPTLPSTQATAETGGVVFTADNPGFLGNSIKLLFNGIDDVDTVVDSWNLLQPDNTVSHDGVGTEVLVAQTIILSGGADDGTVDDSAKLPGVLYPGDKIKIPTSGSPSSPTGVVDNGSDANIVKDLNQAEKNFGVDIQLTDDFDIAVGNNSDARLVASRDNIAQAIVLKILYDVGSLKAHPEIGTDLGIGEKAVNTSLVSDQVRRSLSADSRIDSIIFVETVQEGSSINLNIVLKLKDVDQPLAIPLKLPNAA